MAEEPPDAGKPPVPRLERLLGRARGGLPGLEERLEQARKGLSEGVVALRLGFWGVNHRPGLLLLLALPQFIIGAVALGMDRGLGVPRNSLTYSTAFILTAMLSYIPVMAAAILEADAVGRGLFLSHRDALRQGLRNLRFILVPFLVAWFGVDAIRHLLLLSIPAVTLVAQSPEDIAAALGFVVPVVTTVEIALLLYLACRFLIALPDRVLSEEEPPRMWPAILVLALAVARAAMAGSIEGPGGVQDLETVGGVVTLGVGSALLILLLLALAGRVPAGLTWSWRASRDLDLLAASLVLVAVLSVLTPRAWIFLTTSAGGDAVTGVLLYFLALFLIFGVFGQWGLGLLLAAVLAGLLFLVRPFVPAGRTGLPLVDPFIVAAMWVVPLALLAVSASALYARMAEEE